MSGADEARRRDEHAGQRARPRRPAPSPAVNMRPTRTPSSRDTSGANAAARIRRPRRCAEQQRRSATISDGHDEHDEQVVGREQRRAWPPIRSPSIENARRERCGLPPQIIPASACEQHEQAERDDRPRSAAARPRPGGSPRARPRRRARSPRQQRGDEAEPVGAAWSITRQATNVVTISIAPWAKLTIRVARQISTSASANGGVDRAAGEAVEGEDDEAVHCTVSSEPR